MLRKIGKINIELRRIELHSHQEEIRLGISVLIRMNNVSIVMENEIGDGRDQATAIRTGDEQDGGVLHA